MGAGPLIKEIFGRLLATRKIDATPPRLRASRRQIESFIGVLSRPFLPYLTGPDVGLMTGFELRMMMGELRASWGQCPRPAFHGISYPRRHKRTRCGHAETNGTKTVISRMQVLQRVHQPGVLARGSPGKTSPCHPCTHQESLNDPTCLREGSPPSSRGCSFRSAFGARRCFPWP